MYIVSASESGYAQTSSCASYYFNANFLEHSTTELFRFTLRLPDNFYLLPESARILYCIFERLSYWSQKINYCVLLRLSYFQYLQSNIPASQYFLYIIFHRYGFQMLMFQYFRVPCKCCSICYSCNYFADFWKYLPFIFFLIKKCKHRFYELLWDLNWLIPNKSTLHEKFLLQAITLSVLGPICPVVSICRT